VTTDALIEHVRDLLASMPDIRFRKMFGGAGVYSGGRMFGLIADDQLYIKADDLTRPEFERAGSGPFTYDPGNGRKPTMMGYWRLPAGAEDDPAETERWARLGLAAAERAGAPKPKRRAAAPVHDLGPGPWDG
jgi:DNA transformation protein